MKRDARSTDFQTKIAGLHAQLSAKSVQIENLKLENARLRVQLQAKALAKPASEYIFKKMDMPIHFILGFKASMIGEILPLPDCMITVDKQNRTRITNYASQDGIGSIAKLLRMFLDNTHVSRSFKGSMWLRSIALIRTSMDHFGITEEMINEACGIEHEQEGPKRMFA